MKQIKHTFITCIHLFPVNISYGVAHIEELIHFFITVNRF